MRHPVNEPLDKWICPITGEPFNSAWSEEKTSDSCEQCKPEKYKPLGQRLRELDQQRQGAKL